MNMKVTLDSDVLAYAFIEPNEDIYKQKYEEFEFYTIRQIVYLKMLLRAIMN